MARAAAHNARSSPRASARICGLPTEELESKRKFTCTTGAVANVLHMYMYMLLHGKTSVLFIDYTLWI